MIPSQVPGREDCLGRLRRIFPREGFDSAASSPAAAAAVFVMLYVGALHQPGRPASGLIRPSTVTWMSDVAAAHRDDEELRRSWFAAAMRTRKAVTAWHTALGETWREWYADNTRESIRDDTFHMWAVEGALYVEPTVATTASGARYALEADFAALFDPDLVGDALEDAVAAWQDTHFSPGERLRVRAAQERASAAAGVPVRLPDGSTRHLAPGQASLILRRVVEEWATRRLLDPVVLTLSEPRRKLPIADAAVLAQLGVSIDVSTLLPDAVIADIGAKPVIFWLVEVVATDGPVDEERRTRLAAWAAANYIDPRHCQFLSAFESRHVATARRRLKDLASGTFAWFADEPDHELAWYELTRAEAAPPGEGPPRGLGG